MESLGASQNGVVPSDTKTRITHVLERLWPARCARQNPLSHRRSFYQLESFCAEIHHKGFLCPCCNTYSFNIHSQQSHRLLREQLREWVERELDRASCCGPFLALFWDIKFEGWVVKSSHSIATKLQALCIKIIYIYIWMFLDQQFLSIMTCDTPSSHPSSHLLRRQTHGRCPGGWQKQRCCWSTQTHQQRFCWKAAGSRARVLCLESWISCLSAAYCHLI